MTPMRTRVLTVLLLLSIALPARSTEILVHAAASLTEALREVGKLHEASTGVKVSLAMGASSTLARQILDGAPGDVFISADEAKMDELEHAKLIDPATRRSLLSNSLIIVVAADSKLAIGSSKDLATPAVRSVALADPGSVPAGIYAKEHLRRIGIWSDVVPKVVPTENVRGALSAVEAGNVDAAIVYATDARISTKVRVAYAVPPADAPDISYPVAVLAGSENPHQARAFVTFLASPEATAVFERYGFVVRH